jgi:hypothetical protein
MGYRLHVVKRQERFGDIEAFNWKNNEFADLLTTIGCNICGDEPYDRFECLKSEFRKAIGIVKLYSEKGNLTEDDLSATGIDPKCVDIDDINEILSSTKDELGYTLDELVRIMEQFLSESDPEGNYIIFVAW